MSTATRLTTYLASPCLNEDDEEYGTKLLPPLSATEIAELEDKYDCKFTDEVKELLTLCGGLEEGPMEIIDFKGWDPGYMLPSLRNRFRLISMDGFGNFWFYWSSHVGATLGPIYYYQHEGPMLFYQSDGIADFVEECIRFMTPPYASLIDDVHEFRLRPIRSLNDDLLARETVIAQADSALADFVRDLPPDALLYDFRAAKVGDGVDLAKLHVIALHPRLPVLAVRRRIGVWGWLAALVRSKKK